jgi:hypothetical protein
MRGGAMNESAFQRNVVKKLQTLFPGCFVVRNDPLLNQGVPDILLLFKNKWAMLEFKKSAKAAVRPNQKHYVDLFNKMSFASFIHPGNEEKVLRDLQSTFGTGG